MRRRVRSGIDLRTNVDHLGARNGRVVYARRGRPAGRAQGGAERNVAIERITGFPHSRIGYSDGHASGSQQGGFLSHLGVVRRAPVDLDRSF